ncbi:MAG: metal ABC transporter substrate-binding protein [Actinomycetota bacterium]|nr:metal ABC transporter substrate-binding protein [Actinomycetota bacterium]
MRLAALFLLPLLLTSCSGSGAAPSTPEVVVGAYPFAWLVSQIGGSDITVTDLVKPGVEPHDVELTPRQVGAVKQAALVVYLKGFQPALDDAVEGDNGYDLGTVVQQVKSSEDAGAKDPHVWLDPALMKAMATGVADRLAEVDPSHAQGYRDRAAAVTAKLAALDTETAAALRTCRSRDVVTSHAAFAYFAERYGLTQRGISGLSPDSEPSPKRLAEVADFARKHHVTTIFFESLVSPKLARTVAAEVGAKTAVLDPIEGVQGADDYLSVMRRNTAALHAALGCTP